VHNACAQHFNPALALTHAATRSAALEAGKVNLRARLGVGELVRAEAQFNRTAVKPLHEDL
jgi:hypothetical protein